MSGIRMAGRIIRREIMITDTISTIQQFVKNGGRYEKIENQHMVNLFMGNIWSSSSKETMN